MEDEKMQRDECKCPFCNSEVIFPFCKLCDKEFVKCHTCGSLVEKHVAICSKCGRKL